MVQSDPPLEVLAGAGLSARFVFTALVIAVGWAIVEFFAQFSGPRKP